MGRSICQLPIIITFAVILLGASSHTIHKRQDIIESAASIEMPVAPVPDNSRPLDSGEPDADPIKKVVIPSEDGNNVPTTTDVNNGIEQNYGGHSNTSNTTETINRSQITKDFSQTDSANR